MAVAIAAIAMSCKTGNEETNFDEYYVKYEAVGTSSSMYSSFSLGVTINDENNNKTYFDPGRSFEMIIGPVKGGFNASLDVVSTASAKLNLQISVSKNDGPFAYKADNISDKYRSSAQLYYHINY